MISGDAGGEGRLTLGRDVHVGVKNRGLYYLRTVRFMKCQAYGMDSSLISRA